MVNMNRASFQRLPVHHFFNVALKELNFKRLYKENTNSHLKMNDIYIYIYFIGWWGLSQGWRQMLKIEIDPFSNSISLSLMSLDELFLCNPVLGDSMKRGSFGCEKIGMHRIDGVKCAIKWGRTRRG